MILTNVIHQILRPLLGICLFLSQFTGNRTTFFSENYYILAAGTLVVIAGILLWITASINLQKAIKEKKIAISGTYKYIRHPIYVSIYILSAGLGLIFFAWLWFVVLIAFLPLWYLECRNEEKEMIILFGQEYIDYQKRTGMWLPKKLRAG